MFHDQNQIETRLDKIESSLEDLKAELKRIGSHSEQHSAISFQEKSTDGNHLLTTGSDCLRDELKSKGMPAIPLPPLEYLQQLIRRREARSRFFDQSLFGEPAWDIILDLLTAQRKGRRVSVTSACIASRVPATTALRYIKMLTEKGLILRYEDEIDGRRAFLELTPLALRNLAKYFAQIANS